MKPGTRPLGRVNPRAGFNNYARESQQGERAPEILILLRADAKY